MIARFYYEIMTNELHYGVWYKIWYFWEFDIFAHFSWMKHLILHWIWSGCARNLKISNFLIKNPMLLCIPVNMIVKQLLKSHLQCIFLLYRRATKFWLKSHQWLFSHGLPTHDIDILYVQYTVNTILLCGSWEIMHMDVQYSYSISI